MNSIYNINAKEEIINLLKDDLNDERVKQELSQLVDINYIELLLAKLIADYLKENNQCYIVSGIDNLYIAYLLGITLINPNSEESYIPYEVAFDKWHISLASEFRVPCGITKDLQKYLKEISNNKVKTAINYWSNGKIKRMKGHYLFPIASDSDLTVDYSEIDESKVIKIPIFGFTMLDDMTYFINKYGMPKNEIIEDDEITKEFFENQNVIGLTISEPNEIIKLLKTCDEDIWKFQTYAYIHGMVRNMTNVPNSIECSRINEYVMSTYPTTRGMLYKKCIQLGLSHEEALKVYYYSRKSKYSSEGYRYEDWEELYNLLPSSLADYLDHIDYMWPTINTLVMARFNYLEMYYKLYAPDFYQVKLKEYLVKFDSKTTEEIDELINIQESKEMKSDKYVYLLLYKEYKTKLLSKDKDSRVATITFK